jgi:hypothetical protein
VTGCRDLLAEQAAEQEAGQGEEERHAEVPARRQVARQARGGAEPGEEGGVRQHHEEGGDPTQSVQRRQSLEGDGTAVAGPGHGSA